MTKVSIQEQGMSGRFNESNRAIMSSKLVQIGPFNNLVKCSVLKITVNLICTYIDRIMSAGWGFSYLGCRRFMRALRLRISE